MCNTFCASVVSNLNIPSSVNCGPGVEGVNPHGKWSGSSLLPPTLHRSRQAGGIPPGWRAPRPGGRDQVAPLKSTIGTQRNRLPSPLLLINHDNLLRLRGFQSPWWLRCSHLDYSRSPNHLRTVTVRSRVWAGVSRSIRSYFKPIFYLNFYPIICFNFNSVKRRKFLS